MEFIDLQAQYKKLQSDIDQNIKTVLKNGNYIMGPFVRELEEQLSRYVGVKHCVSCANGTDALSLVLMAWGITKGDAVFVPNFTFYATSEVVDLCGATPIFIDIDKDTFNMDVQKLEKAIVQVMKEGKLRPKVIIPVDLFGQPADFEEIQVIANKYRLYVLEDAAQGFGGSINSKRAGSFGDAATTSFFPAKPLGCYGDGGAIFTNQTDLYEKLMSLRTHGKGTYKYDNVRVGLNSRLDTIQAGILLVKLKAFEEFELEQRNKIAKQYTTSLMDVVKTPVVRQGYISSWAQYTITLQNEQQRDFLQAKLKEKNIPTMVYYPKPLHKQTVYEHYSFNVDDLQVSEQVSKCVLSLPMHPYVSEEDIAFICACIKEIMESM